MIKSIIKGFSNQCEYSSICEYGIQEAHFKSFIRMKKLGLSKLVNSKYYCKIMSILYLIQVLIIVLCFILLFVLNYLDKSNFLRIKI